MKPPRFAESVGRVIIVLLHNSCDFIHHLADGCSKCVLEKILLPLFFKLERYDVIMWTETTRLPPQATAITVINHRISCVLRAKRARQTRLKTA